MREYIGTLGTMEAEEIYMNQEARMQAAAFKDKQKGIPDNKKGVDDPAYENITLTFRNRDQPKGSHSSPKKQVPARSRPFSDSAQAPSWLHRAITCLYILLVLLCIILLVWILVKGSNMSQELLKLQSDLKNVSKSVQECQEEQTLGWSKVKQRITDTQKLIATVMSNVQTCNKKLETLPTDIGNIKTKLDKISEKLQTIQTEKAQPSLE
ncbi:mast cell-expressed membrane protein 1 [Rhinolophus sinicus]|uniref:mast cell-expressed membrane protein 1 n=1 Tax=Rhinolophus sinicus TaxID=89399 RepID=UPI00094208EB|nr:PREDICTED: mast cell-expressed membrane protein 1 [Rhinolophus sinicus]